MSGKRRKRVSKEKALRMLAQAVEADSMDDVMIVDRKLLRWAMEVAVPDAKRQTLIAPLRRRTLVDPPARRTTG